MPTACLACEGSLLIPARVVVASAVANAPYECEHCGDRLSVPLDRLGTVAFFDRDAWDAWDDTADPEPAHYHLVPDEIRLLHEMSPN